VGAAIPTERLYDCINVMLSYQNPSGGWATYENTRSFAWVEVGRPDNVNFVSKTPIHSLIEFPRVYTYLRQRASWGIRGAGRGGGGGRVSLPSIGGCFERNYKI